jgi:hypothetical protein
MPTVAAANCRVGVWQALADGEPDVDAIFRLVAGRRSVEFRTEEPIVLADGTVCPFNSQNTVFRREAFALLYLPALVSFRFTDILRSLVAQPVLWAAGLRVGFTRATVVQDRNAHDLMDDFESEVAMYLSAERAVEIAREAVNRSCAIPENLRAVYRALSRARIVDGAEVGLLDLWLEDLASLGWT